MKLRVKISNKQMLSLLDFLQKFDVDRKEVDKLILINLNEFAFHTSKYFVLKEFNLNKYRVFKIDVNHFVHLYSFMQDHSDSIEPFYIHLLDYIHHQVEPQINCYKSLIFNPKIYQHESNTATA